jgi:hypothetical protein
LLVSNDEMKDRYGEDLIIDKSMPGYNTGRVFPLNL